MSGPLIHERFLCAGKDASLLVVIRAVTTPTLIATNRFMAIVIQPFCATEIMNFPPLNFADVTARYGSFPTLCYHFLCMWYDKIMSREVDEIQSFCQVLTSMTNTLRATTLSFRLTLFKFSLYIPKRD